MLESKCFHDVYAGCDLRAKASHDHMRVGYEYCRGKGIDREHRISAQKAQIIFPVAWFLLSKGSRKRGWDLHCRAFVCAQREIRVVGIRERARSLVRRVWPSPNFYKKE